MACQYSTTLQVGKDRWIRSVSSNNLVIGCRVYGKMRAKDLTWTPVCGPVFFPKQLSDKHPAMIPPRVIDIYKMRKVVTQVCNLHSLIPRSFRKECDQEQRKHGSPNSIASKSYTKNGARLAKRSSPDSAKSKSQEETKQIRTSN